MHKVVGFMLIFKLQHTVYILVRCAGKDVALCTAMRYTLGDVLYNVGCNVIVYHYETLLVDSMSSSDFRHLKGDRSA